MKKITIAVFYCLNIERQTQKMVNIVQVLHNKILWKEGKL